MELSSVSGFSPLPSAASTAALHPPSSAAQLEGGDDAHADAHHGGGDPLDEARDLVAHPVDAPHAEKHFSGAEIVRDVVIGMADGLTVPFALAAGLSALDSSAVVVTAGLAEIVAGGISMGLGGYLAGRTEIEHYNAERRREQWEVDHCLRHELDEIVEIFEPYGLDREALRPMLNVLATNKETFVDFMMRFELGLELPSKNRALQSAATIGISYILGGIVPLFPYFFESDAQTAMYISIALTLTALFIFGAVKAHFTGVPRIWLAALQMMLVGAVAAGAAYGIARLLLLWEH